MTYRRALIETILFILIAAAGFVGCWKMAQGQVPGLGPGPTYYYRRQGPIPVQMVDGGTSARTAKLARANLDVPGLDDDSRVTGYWTFAGGLNSPAFTVIQTSGVQRGSLDSAGIWASGNQAESQPGAALVIYKAFGNLDGAYFDVQESTSPATSYTIKVPNVGVSGGRFRMLLADSATGLVYPTTGGSSFADTSFFVVDNNVTTRRIGFTATNIPNDTTYTLVPPASGTLVLANNTQTLANKSVSLGSNTVTATKAQLNTAVTDDNPAYVGTANTFTANQAMTGSLLVDNGFSHSNGSGFYVQSSAANLAADRTFRWPNSDGTVTLNDNTAPLDNKTIRVTNTAKLHDNKLTVADEADTTKTLVFSLGGGTTAKATTIVSSPTLARTITLPNATTTLAGLSVANTWTAAQTHSDFVVMNTGAQVFFYNGAGTNVADLSFASGTADVTIELPSISGTLIVGSNPVSLTNQGADIASSAVAPVAGKYTIEVYALCTTADVTAGAITVTLSWSDLVGATTSTPVAALTLAATGRATGRQFAVSTGAVNYTVTHTGIYGTAKYALYISVVSL